MKKRHLTIAAALMFGAITVASADNGTSSYPPRDKADNTGINERDRNGAMMQPTDQSSNQADLDVTANIRKAVMRDSSLSINAKNVKIITANGKVTLRGPVKNEAEIKKVVAKAKRLSGKNIVVNELEIAAP